MLDLNAGGAGRLLCSSSGARLSTERSAASASASLCSTSVGRKGSAWGVGGVGFGGGGGGGVWCRFSRRCCRWKALCTSGFSGSDFSAECCDRFTCRCVTFRYSFAYHLHVTSIGRPCFYVQSRPSITDQLWNQKWVENELNLISILFDDIFHLDASFFNNMQFSYWSRKYQKMVARFGKLLLFRH